MIKLKIFGVLVLYKQRSSHYTLAISKQSIEKYQVIIYVAVILAGLLFGTSLSGHLFYRVFADRSPVG